MKNQPSLMKKTPLMAIGALIILSGISATSIGGNATNPQPTMTCTMGMENSTMMCNDSMMTTITGILQHHGQTYKIGNITLSDGANSCCAGDGAAKEIRKTLIHLVGETITVSGMLDCDGPSTLMIHSINGIAYRAMCC
jgi:hypothetical protein